MTSFSFSPKKKKDSTTPQTPHPIALASGDPFLGHSFPVAGFIPLRALLTSSFRLFPWSPTPHHTTPPGMLLAKLQKTALAAGVSLKKYEDGSDLEPFGYLTAVHSDIPYIDPETLCKYRFPNIPNPVYDIPVNQKSCSVRSDHGDDGADEAGVRKDIGDVAKDSAEFPTQMVSNSSEVGIVPDTCDFEKRFLDKLNPHPRDQHILFDEGPHKYYVYRKMWPTSTTSWIGQFHVEFDADTVAPVMVRKEKFSKCQGDYKKYEPIVRRWREEELHIDEVVSLVKEWWKANGEEASALGTRMHKQIEDYINEYAEGVPGPLDHPDRLTPEFSQFLEYWKIMTEKGFRPYRTEMKVFSEKYRLCGTVDMLFIDPQGRYRLRDWKRSKKIDTFSRDFCHPPFQRFRSCNFIKYSMQLHFYAKVLGDCYDIPIHDMAMVIFHPNQKVYNEIQAVDLSREMDIALSRHARMVQLSAENRTE